MSILVGMVGRDYTIIATDTRTTMLNAPVHHDNAEKLLMTEWGWVGNSGGVDLHTTFFKQYLLTGEIKTRNDIYLRWLRSIKKVHEFAEMHVDAKTCKLATSETSNSQALYSLNYFKNGLAYMSVEAIDFAYGMRKLTEINSLVVNPPKSTKRIKRAIEKYSDLVTNTTGLFESIYLLACCIDQISKYTDWINNTIDFGVSLQISDSEILLINIHKNAKEIKRLYEANKDLSELMKVRSVIHA